MQNQAKRVPIWVWFFITLVVLAAIPAAVLIVYNLGQQLKSEDLAKAQELWRKNGPASYRLVYSVKRGDSPAETFVVHVRNGTTQFVLSGGKKLDERQNVHYGMEELFDNIERFLELDRPPDPAQAMKKTFLRGSFDPKDGHLLSFVRRVMGGRERVEIVVKELEPLH